MAGITENFDSVALHTYFDGIEVFVASVIDRVCERFFQGLIRIVVEALCFRLPGDLPHLFSQNSRLKVL